MRYVLFEDPLRNRFLPLAFTRPLWDLRIGIDRIFEKWDRSLPAATEKRALSHLAPLFDSVKGEGPAMWINCRFLPNAEFVRDLLACCEPDSYVLDAEGTLIAVQMQGLPEDALHAEHPALEGLRELRMDTGDTLVLRQLPDFFQLNAACIRADFEHYGRITGNRVIKDPHTVVYGRENVYFAEGAEVRAAIINAEDGPVYIGRNVQVQEGAIIHGTHAFCEHSVVNMGAKLRGDSTIGPWSKVGGEIANSVIQGYSNKGHDGYLGNSLLGYWCNLGADTNTSNLKNNYAEVRLWDYGAQRFSPTGTQFCGLVMGDHSKCGINTMFNTGTVVGVSANIFGAGFPRNFIPSFSWGGAAGMSVYAFAKAMEVAEAVMKRRNIKLEEADRELLRAVFEMTQSYRKFS